MLNCRQVTEMATDRAEGNLRPLERLRFDRHVERCDGCRTYVRQLNVVPRAVALLPEPDVSPALNAALMAQFDSVTGTRAAGIVEPPRDPAPSTRRVSPWPVLGTVAVLGLLLAFGRHRSQAPGDWILGALLAAAALAVAALSGRMALGVVVAGLSAALAAAVLGGSAGALAADHGVVCFSMEILSASVVGAAAWLGARGGSGAMARRAVAGGAVAGALASDAALQITCGAHDSMPHLLAFHAGGVVLVAMAALLALRGRAVEAGA